MKRPGVSEEAVDLLAEVLELAGVDPSDLSHEQRVRRLAGAYLDALDELKEARREQWPARGASTTGSAGAGLDERAVEAIAERASQARRESAAIDLDDHEPVGQGSEGPGLK